MDFYRKPLTDIFLLLESRPAGLSSGEVRQRQEIYGTNELQAETAVNPLLIFINQFKSFIIYILLFAVAFSLLISEYVDTLIILAILLVNAFIGFFQELGAHRSLEALKRISTLLATVVRAGEVAKVPARELVPGDIVLIEAGDRVPADLRIMESVRLKVDESTLTGESVPVDKNSQVIAGQVPIGDRMNMLYSATSVATGHARGIVVSIGMQTELGRITSLIEESEQEMTPLQRRLDRFGKNLGYAIITICILVFVLFISRAPADSSLSVEVIMAFAFVAISLAVAAVPTALPAVVTIALSIGVKRLLTRRALVRNLSSVETLGSCDIICTDKTGTLTENQMTVRQAWTLDGEATLSGTGYDPRGTVVGSISRELFLCGLICNNASLFHKENSWRIAGDPTEAALLVSAVKAGVNSEASRVDEIPFDADRKLMSVRVSTSEGECLYAKGALDSVMARSSKVLVGGHRVPMTAGHVAAIECQNRSYASQAMRVLAFASRPLDPSEGHREEALTFIGLQAMIDPPRPDVAESIARARAAGIRIIMVTGDYGETARAIGEEVGISGNMVNGADLPGMDDEELAGALQAGAAIFSRVAPEHKYRLISVLQEMGT